MVRYDTAETDRGDGSPPTILVVGGVIPDDRYVGEIVLLDLCNLYPAGKMACFGLTGRQFDPATSPRISPALVRSQRPRFTPGWRPWRGRVGTLASFVATQSCMRWDVKQRIEDAAEFGRQLGVEKIWMVLDTPQTIAIGPRIAERLRVPLISMVWDHPQYLLRSQGIDRVSRTWLMREFARTLRCSQSVAVVSEAMQDEYQRLYDARTVVLRHGPSMEFGMAAASAVRSADEFRIGFAGGIYATSAWNALLAALAAVNWQIAGRRVVLRIFGSDFRFRLSGPVNIEYLGFRPRAELARFLGECHAAYVPQPFEPEKHDLAKYSFPNKLSTYLAAGLPTFIHAPVYASLVQFEQRFSTGVCCTSLAAADLVSNLQRLAEPQYYREACSAAKHAIQTELSHETFLCRTAQFLGVRREVLTIPEL